MNIQAGVARFCFFDLHFTPAPLRAPALFQPAVSFLGVPAEYEKRFGQVWQVDTSRFSLRPMVAGLQWSHFWKGLRTLCDLEGTNEKFAHYHIPIEGLVRDAEIVAKLPAPFGASKVRARLLVWPYGWSTRLEVSLTGPAGLPELVKASQALRQDSIFSLTISGKPVLSAAPLSTVLRDITTWMQKDLFTGTVPDQRPISRHTVIGLSNFNEPAEPFSYNLDIDPQQPQLPTADRARLHSMLLGREVPLAEVLQREKAKAFLLTPLKKRGFALTDFDQGSLLVLQVASPRAGKGDTVARCLWRNTAAMLTTTNALLSVDRGVRTKAGDWLDQSADWGVRILSKLPDYYDNMVCRRIFETNGRVRKAGAKVVQATSGPSDNSGQ